MTILATLAGWLLIAAIAAFLFSPLLERSAATASRGRRHDGRIHAGAGACPQSGISSQR